MQQLWLITTQLDSRRLSFVEEATMIELKPITTIAVAIVVVMCGEVFDGRSPTCLFSVAYRHNAFDQRQSRASCETSTLDNAIDLRDAGIGPGLLPVDCRNV
jgi:hypothetical protein